MRHTHDALAGTDDLPRLGQSLDDHAVRISKEDCVARLVAGHVGPGLGRADSALAASAAALALS